MAQLVVDEVMQMQEDESESETETMDNNGLDTAGLRHLCVMDPTPLDEMKLRAAADVDGDDLERLLHRTASDVMGKMVEVLWQLPIERTSQGPVATLPPQRGKGILPREKPVPVPKQETKWEKFAREKGINNKQKRGKMVWDDVEQKWAPRYGYKRAYDDSELPIMEVKAGDDPFDDPWEKKRQEKKERVAKNEQQRARNTERAAKRSQSVTAGLPIDLRSSEAAHQSPGDSKKDRNSTRDESEKKLQKGKDGVNATLALAQRSTASIGKFDIRRVGEKEQRLPQGALGVSGRKRSIGGAGSIMENSMTPQGLGIEKDRNSSILSKVAATAEKGPKQNIKGSRGERIEERKRRREFHPLDDSPFENMGGGEAGEFKKKKGRAGAGKARKITKKRIK